MVGKLNDMVTAAVVVDSAPSTKPVGEQDFARIKPVSTQPGSSQSVAAKPLEALTPAEKEEQKQEARLEPGSMSEKSVSEMTETFNKLMDKINCDVEFKYNKEVEMFNVKMIDKKTNEVIKEFPPEEMIENMIKAKDWLGAFIDRAV